MHSAKLAGCLGLLVLSAAASLPGATLRAGVAKVDITPPVGVPMWGYTLRNSTGTLDPLYARVLVLEVGEERLALVALDLGRCFGHDSLERLRAAVRQSSGISYLLAAASHTHSGPVVQDAYRNGTPAWETAALDKIAQAVADAHQHAFEARLGTGYGVAYIGHNRHRANRDGTVTWFEHNPTQIPTAPVDPTVAVLRVDTADGRPLAVLVNYACHPVVFGPDNTQYSADYPGVMTKTVEQALGGQPLCFFLQGAPGDINSYYAVIPLKENAAGRRDWTGEELGKEAARVAKEIRTEAVAEPSLDFTEDMLNLHFRWNAEKFHKAALASGEATDPRAFDAYFPSTAPEQQFPVATVLLNRRIALMGVPGEPFVDFQMNWRARCPVSDCFFLGYANGYFGYFPTIRAATEGGYGAASASTWIEPGAGERMVDHAVIKVYGMLGLLTDAPEDHREDYTVTRPRRQPGSSR
jgi:neutral ceramidase